MCSGTSSFNALSFLTCFIVLNWGRQHFQFITECRKKKGTAEKQCNKPTSCVWASCYFKLNGMMSLNFLQNGSLRGPNSGNFRGWFLKNRKHIGSQNFGQNLIFAFTLYLLKRRKRCIMSWPSPLSNFDVKFLRAFSLFFLVDTGS